MRVAIGPMKQTSRLRAPHDCAGGTGDASAIGGQLLHCVAMQSCFARAVGCLARSLGACSTANRGAALTSQRAASLAPGNKLSTWLEHQDTLQPQIRSNAYSPIYPLPLISYPACKASATPPCPAPPSRPRPSRDPVLACGSAKRIPLRMIKGLMMLMSGIRFRFQWK